MTKHDHSHDHSHDHGHSHSHETEHMSDSRLVWAVAVNILLTVAQIVGGVIANSLSLVADAMHNLNDAASLGLALIARRIGRKPPDEYRTFGYNKAPVIGALINLTTLIIVGLYLIYEAVARFFEKPEIGGWIVVIVAGIALIVDIITAVLTHAMSKESINIKAAYLHNVSDALASIGVMIAGTLIILFNWYVADLIATLIISFYILYQGFVMIRSSIRILMDSAPKGFSLTALVKAVTDLEGILDIHHIHIWNLDEHRTALEAHITVSNNTNIDQIEKMKNQIKAMLRNDFQIHHATLEFECEKADEHDRRLVVG